jgi:hypothetical protein
VLKCVCSPIVAKILSIKGDAMRSHRQLFFLTLILFGALFTAACEETTISKINADPSRYREKEVGIKGRVTDSYGVLNQGFYEIDDGTGRIWVIARRRGVPSKGSEIGVKGRVFNGLSFGGRTFGTVLEESGRKVR